MKPRSGLPRDQAKHETGPTINDFAGNLPCSEVADPKPGFFVTIGAVGALSRHGLIQVPGCCMGIFAKSAVFGAFSLAFMFAQGAVTSTEAARRLVSFSTAYPAGTIVIVQRQRKLYLSLGDGRAIRYPVAIGRRGKAWSGWTHVEGKFVRPAWSPPAAVKRWNPRIPDVIPGGSPRNPMGARAITLARREIAIHGTTRAMRRSVGTAASFGCIRMYNEDVIDLYNRVHIGARVLSIP